VECTCFRFPGIDMKPILDPVICGRLRKHAVYSDVRCKSSDSAFLLGMNDTKLPRWKLQQQDRRNCRKCSFLELMSRYVMISSLAKEQERPRSRACSRLLD
jgi:hypothetical protein